MKQIYLLISCSVGAIASIDPWDQSWPKNLPLYTRDILKERLLRPRSPMQQIDRSSSPMYRAKHAASPNRPQHVPLNGRREPATVPDTQHARQSSSRSSSPMQRAQNLPFSSPSPGSSSGNIRRPPFTRQSTTRSPGLTHGSQNDFSASTAGTTGPRPTRWDDSPSRSPQPQQASTNPYNTMVRATVIGPAIVDVPENNGQGQSGFIPWGRGEFVSVSGADRHGMNVKTLSEGPDRSGEVSLDAQGHRATQVVVTAEHGANGKIERKAPLPEMQRHVHPGRTESEITRANPPQHQYLMGHVKGDGEVMGLAISPDSTGQ